MKKNEIVEVTIEDMGINGEGIGRVNGYTLSVSYTHLGQIDDKPVVLHTFCLVLFGSLRFRRLVTAQDCAHTRHQFFGVKGLHHIVVSAQLQPQNLIKDLALGGEHDDGGGRFGADFPAYLITVNPRQHQIQQNEVGLVRCV